MVDLLLKILKTLTKPNLISQNRKDGYYLSTNFVKAVTFGSPLGEPTVTGFIEWQEIQLQVSRPLQWGYQLSKQDT